MSEPTEPTLTKHLTTMGRRVGALEEEQSNPDSITRIVKGYGRVRIRAVLTWSKYTFRVCSESLPCSEGLIM